MPRVLAEVGVGGGVAVFGALELACHGSPVGNATEVVLTLASAVAALWPALSNVPRRKNPVWNELKS